MRCPQRMVSKKPGGAQDEQLALARRERRLVEEIVGVRHDAVDQLGQVQQSLERVVGAAARRVLRHELLLNLIPLGLGYRSDPRSFQHDWLARPWSVDSPLRKRGNRRNGDRGETQTHQTAQL